MRFMMLMIPKGYEKAAPGAMPDAKAVAGSCEPRAARHRASSEVLISCLTPLRIGFIINSI